MEAYVTSRRFKTDRAFRDWNHPKVDGFAFGAGGTRTARLGPGAIPLDMGTRLRVLLSLLSGEGRMAKGEGIYGLAG